MWTKIWSEIFYVCNIQVNANISLLQSSSVVSLCNPFSEPPAYQYQPENCPSNAIKIGDIAKVCYEPVWNNGMQEKCFLDYEISYRTDCRIYLDPILRYIVT